MTKIPITKDFRDDVNSLMGYAELHPEAKATLEKFIETGIIPHFAISFIGEPDENGVYHNAELIGISMIAGREPYGKSTSDSK